MKIRKNIALSDTGFIFDPSTGNSFSTNPIGLQLIQLMKNGKTMEEIEAEITETYAVDKSEFERDFYDFRKMLGLLKLADDHEKEKN